MMKRPRCSCSRQGISLIEYLAVIAIISVFIFMMIPAILNSRKAAARLQCLNNMKQIVLAFHNYQDSFVTLPSGVVNPTGPITNPSLTQKPSFGRLDIGWAIQVLPYLEQRMLVSSCDTNVSVYADINATGRGTQINSFACPVEIPSVPYWAKVGGKIGPGSSLVGISSYAGCHNDVESPIDVANHGVLFLNSRIRQQDVYDGTSTTIYIAEKRIEPGDLGWMSGTRATLRNTGTRLNAPMSDKVAEPLYVGGFSSNHPGGVNAGFGDGSVRFLRDSIAPQVLRNLGNRDDGELVEGLPQ